SPTLSVFLTPARPISTLFPYTTLFRSLGETQCPAPCAAAGQVQCRLAPRSTAARPSRASGCDHREPPLLPGARLCGNRLGSAGDDSGCGRGRPRSDPSARARRVAVPPARRRPPAPDVHLAVGGVLRGAHTAWLSPGYPAAVRRICDPPS